MDRSNSSRASASNIARDPRPRPDEVGTLSQQLMSVWFFHAVPDLQSLPRDDRWAAARQMAAEPAR